MELETVVLENTEEMDLGEAQQTFNNYPQLKEAFQTKSSEYKAFVAELKFKHHATITRVEIEKADALYEEVKRLQEECLDMKAILSRKLEELVLEGKELEGDLAFHGRDFDIEGMDWGRSLLKEALELRNHNELTGAVEKAYEARECLARLLVQVKIVWIRKHGENADRLTIGQEA